MNAVKLMFRRLWQPELDVFEDVPTTRGREETGKRLWKGWEETLGNRGHSKSASLAVKRKFLLTRQATILFKKNGWKWVPQICLGVNSKKSEFQMAYI